MIGADHEGLIDTPHSENSPRRLGGPLLMIGALFLVWVTGRAVLWENPYTQNMVFQASQLLAKKEAGSVASRLEPIREFDGPSIASIAGGKLPRVNALEQRSMGDQGPAPRFDAYDAHMAAGHFHLWQAAVTSDVRATSWRSRRHGFSAAPTDSPILPGQPPFTSGKEGLGQSGRIDRWSLGAWVFAREGSVGSMITPGPAPVYGASQLGTNLQYRFNPQSTRDPRAYLRVARALIDQGETEIAAGVSARPKSSLPIRVAAEVRATDHTFGRDIRPAAFAITELPPQPLPLDLTAEVYAAGGYVGGEADTLFADGLATVTRGVASFDLRQVDDIRFSIGAGAWGGAQRGVHRVDVGPTLRMDMALGSVPARVSIDYRERVAGDATPASGVAATLSTQF